MKQFSFPGSARLRLKKVFDLVFNQGVKTSTRDLVMWSCRPGRSGKKLGLVVSKKTGGAVQRNRLKRLLREAFRLSKDGLMDGTSIIIYPKAGCGIKNLLDARKAMGAVWTRAGITNAER